MPVSPPIVAGPPTPWIPSVPMLEDEADPARTGGSRSGYSTAWQQWWRYNGDPYLRLRTLIANLSSTTGTVEASASARAGYRPSTAQVRDVVVPALRASLKEASSTELTRGALIALARIGRGNDLRGLTLDHAAKFYLGDEHQPSIEAALVALGLRADPKSARMLLDLATNNEAGRDLRGGQWVDARTRVFATYALGLLSRRAGDPALSAEIGAELTRLFVTDETATFEMHVALMLAMGLAPDEECDGSTPIDLESLGEEDAHICRGTQVVALLDYFRDEDRPFELRAHAAVPLARLSRDADPQLKAAAAEALIESLGRLSKQHPTIRHSSAIALGSLGDGDEDRVDREIRDTLTSCASKGEDLLRRLSMISLAKVSARSGDLEEPGPALARTKKFLTSKLATGRGDTSAWAAIALSILGHDRNQETAEIPAGITAALRDSVAARSTDRASAAALGIGVLRDYESAASLLKRLGDREPEEVRSYAALALGMLGAREAAGPLKELLEEDEAGPMLIGSASIALRLLGREDAAEDLFARIDELEEPEEQLALVSAAGVLGDSAAIERLIAMMNDPERDDAVRGGAALALGVLCDDRTESWTADLSEDINYNLLTWTLRDPFGDGLGILDMR